MNVSSSPSLPPAGWRGHPLIRWGIGLFLTVIAGALSFEAFDISIFKRIGLAHEFCYQRDPRLIWLHVVSDILIGVAYVSISATLGYLVYKASRDIPFNWVFLAFGLFIVSCGLTHFMEVWVIWQPVYWLSGYIKVLTAVASIATALALFPLLPRVFTLIENARRGDQRRIEIEQLNQELERFNYTVAHDLRAPLRSVTSYAQLLHEDCGPQLSADGRGYLERIQSSATRMERLISDLLEYATINQRHLELKPIRLDGPLQGALALLEADIRERDAEIVYPPRLPMVLGDPVMLQSIFQNLVGNALKFVPTHVRPRVEITHETMGDRLLVTITDNGVGIPSEFRERVFRIFERLQASKPGTGIGLAMVQRAVERLNGTVGIADTREGSGARFWFSLPAARPPRSE